MTTIKNIEIVKKKVPPHWYKKYIVECPVCGSRDEWVERVYGIRPDDPMERVDYQEEYDNCDLIF